MLAEEKRNDGTKGPAWSRPRSGPRAAPEGPGRPAPAAAAGKRRRLPGDCAADPGRDGEPARKRPGEWRQAGRSRAAAEGSPSGAAEPRGLEQNGQRPDGGSAAAERRGKRPSAEPGAPGPVSGGAARRLSRRQRRNKQKNQRRQENELQAGPGGERGAGGRAASGPDTLGPPGLAAAPLERSAALRARMEERLLAARFRYINQQLYTSTSREAAQLFQSDPEAFEIYHRGFAQQVGRWPENPVHRIVRYLRRRPTSLVVADFGCGDCKIATSVKNKVHSFDLVPLSPLVTVCDMAKVPLADESVDVAVFCLALMGTNLQEILEEANRVLKQGGTLMVAEVASRFEDIRAFVNGMAQLGFKSVSKDLSNAFFHLLEFAKAGPPRRRPATGLRLRPCLYKRR
ncbi:ribosomal RNA-processing protein 8 isoform X2 [Phalacrocorax carbo]|uniref:ribosomal RNA-processing protein 8 isoform X2 n=1 Tax=Phalacrocorax carbo TaxID=9209 RepID=UPI00311A342C